MILFWLQMPPGQQGDNENLRKQSQASPNHGMLSKKGYGPMTASRILITKLHGWKVPAVTSVGRVFLPWGLPQDRASDRSHSTRLDQYFSLDLEQFSFLLTMYNPDMPHLYIWIPEPALKRAITLHISAGRQNLRVLSSKPESWALLLCF